MNVASPESINTDEVGNVIFNETRSFSGRGIDLARYLIAQAIYNGAAARGTNRPLSAPSTVGHIPNSERGTYMESQATASMAASDRQLGIDPTNGAMYFNFRNSSSTSPFFGFNLTTQVGPLDNSFTGGGLNSTGVYANTYGGH